MTSIQPAQDFVDRASGVATCHLLNAGTGIAASVAANSVYTGQIWGVVGGAIGTAAFAALGTASGCYNNPDDPPSDTPPIGCRKTDQGVELVWEKLDGSGQGAGIAGNIVEIINVFEGKDSFNYDIWIVTAQSEDGTIQDYPGPRRFNEPLIIFLDPQSTGAECLSEGDPDKPIAPDLDYEDEETGCQWTIETLDTYIGPSGLPHVLYRATASDPSCGGPFQWWDSPTEGPKPVGPNPRDPDGNPPPPDLNPPTFDYSDDFKDIKDRLERIEDCACSSEPIPQGEFRTISFRSDETSPYGKSRLRKRLRYRSLSGNDLGTLVDYWKDFSFEGGPYRVRWTGGTWGTVEVWAASEAEGKRVIQHAAGEAGFDAFETGRWSVRVTSSSRRGVPCTVRVDTTGGYYWITARDGSDQRPMVALT